MLNQFAALLLMLFACSPSFANKPGNITKDEMAVISRYCPDTQGFGYGDAYSNTSPRAKGWVALMGPDFWNIHHYCWAQISLLRSQKTNIPRQTKRALLEEVLIDLRYVITNSRPDFVLLPELLTKMGEIELRLSESWVPNNSPQLQLGHIKNANEALTRARSILPNYWPAYFHWTEFLIRTGKLAEAKELVKEGLEYSPASRALAEQYKRLGGNPSDVVPRTMPSRQDAEGDDFREKSSQTDSTPSDGSANSSENTPGDRRQ